MGRLLALACALVSTACGSSNAKPDALIVLIDAPADAPPPGPNLVKIDIFGGTPSLITYRDGAGPWLVPMLDTQGAYELHVTNDFQLVVVCADATGFESSLFNYTAAEITSLGMFCNKNLPPPPTTVVASGQMTQPGTIFMYDTATSSTGPWSFSLDVPTGTHELVAYDASNILIRRNQVVSGATSIATVDLAAGGTAMNPVSLTINNRTSGDSLKTDLDLLLAHDFASLTGTSPTIMTPPSSVLVSGDFEILFLTISTATTFRYVDTQFSATQTTFDLMPELTGIAYAQTGDVLTAAWSALPTSNEISLALYTPSTSSTPSFQNVSATQGWLAATGSSQLAFDVSPPGYDASWKIGLAGPYVREFSAFGGSGPVSMGTSLLEGVNGASPHLISSGFERERSARRQASAR